MKEILELQFLGLVGLILHYGKAWVAADKKGQKYDLKKAIPMAVLSAVTTAVLIYLKDDIKEFFVVTRISAIVLGYFGNSVFFSMIETKKPIIKPEN